MSRALAILVAATLVQGTAWAQAESPAPATDPGTKLAFPATLGGAHFERSANGPGRGTTYVYSTPKNMVITVQIFDNGRPVPPGSVNPVVVGEFTKELQAIEQQVTDSGYTHFERPAVPSACTYGRLTFRCITYGALTQGNARIYSKLLLTGYREHFIEIHIDWGQALQHTSADAEAALQAFVPALMH